MPAFEYLKLSNVLACQGAQSVYGVLHLDDLESATDVMAVEDQESLVFQHFRVDTTGTVRPITAALRAGRVISVVWSNGAVDEWRVGSVIQGRGQGGLISVACVPLWLDLVERADSSTGKGWVSDLTVGIRNFEFEITERTAAQIWATYIIPNCPSWVTAGTIDPTYVIPSLSVSRMTPGALALAVRDTLRNVDVPCEVQLRQNGTTDYKLDLVTQIGASAATPVLHPSIALLALQQKSDPTLQATRVLVKGGMAPDGFPGQLGLARFRGGAPSGNVIALTDRNGGASPIAFDNQFVGNFLLRVKTGATFAITASSASGGTVTLGGGVSTIAADEDFEFRLTEPLTNTRTTVTRYAVSAIPDGTHITLGVSAPVIADNQYVDWYARVWTLGAGGSIVATTRITGSVASTDVIAVLSSTGVTTAHFVEFIQLDGAGEVPAYVDHPTYSAADPIGYGIKVMELSKPMIGSQQIGRNAWMRTWTTGGSPPDGWTVSGGGTNSRNTNAAYTRYGGYSWRLQGTGSASPTVLTPVSYHNNTDGLSWISARALVYFASYTFSITPTSAVFSLYAALADGTKGRLLSRVTVFPVGANQAGFVEVAEGTWVELKVNVPLVPNGIPSATPSVPFGVIAEFVAPPAIGADTSDCYLDVIETHPFSDCPNEATEFGDAPALLQSGNNQLRAVATPPLFYTFGVRDLARAFPDEYGRLATTPGGNVRAVDTEYGIDATVRLLRRDRNLLNAMQTQLTLANRPALMTSMQSAASATQRRVIAAVNAGGSSSPSAGPTFTPLTANTTLTTGAEIATPEATAPVITLPAAPPMPTAAEETGASVTFVPPDPTTTPTIVVTVGRPPSRKKPSIPLE